MGVDDTARVRRVADFLTVVPWQGVAVLVLAAAGVWLLAGLAWALICAAGLLLLDLVSDFVPERGVRGRSDR